MRLVSLMDVEPYTTLDVKRAYKAGEWETDPILWRNLQWAVTEYGIENVRGPYHYHIAKSDFHIPMGTPDRTWVHHMASKNWVDAELFEEAFQHALEIYGSRA